MASTCTRVPIQFVILLAAVGRRALFVGSVPARWYGRKPGWVRMGQLHAEESHPMTLERPTASLASDPLASQWGLPTRVGWPLSTAVIAKGSGQRAPIARLCTTESILSGYMRLEQ